MKIKSYIVNHWKKILLIAVLFTVFLGRYEYKMPKRNFADFHVYYYSGQKMLKGENVYDDQAYKKDKVANFKYPPLFASITALFALTSENNAAIIWFIINFILIIIFVFYSGKLIFDDKSISYRAKNWIYFWALFLTSRFYMHNFDEGQVNFLMMTTLFLGIYSSFRGKDFLGGLLIGFSILVKYMGAIFIPFFLIKKKFKLVFYILVSQIIFYFLPVLFWGWQKNQLLQARYIPYVFKTCLDFGSLSDCANQSLMAVVVRFFSNYGNYKINLMNLNEYSLGFISGCLLLLFYTISLSSRKRSKFDINIKLGMLSICAALFNPNAWMHAFIFLTFGYMVAFYYLFRINFADRIVIVLLFLSFFLHSLSASFFTRFWAGDLFEIFSFVALGAIALFICLAKIKFYPKVRIDY